MPDRQQQPFVFCFAGGPETASRYLSFEPADRIITDDSYTGIRQRWPLKMDGFKKMIRTENLPQGANGETADFWAGKVPCWEMLDCNEYVYTHCAAYRNRRIPCWETIDTQCRKILDFAWACQDCKVFIAYGAGGKSQDGGADPSNRW